MFFRQLPIYKLRVMDREIVLTLLLHPRFLFLFCKKTHIPVEESVIIMLIII